MQYILNYMIWHIFNVTCILLSHLHCVGCCVQVAFLCLMYLNCLFLLLDFCVDIQAAEYIYAFLQPWKKVHQKVYVVTDLFSMGLISLYKKKRLDLKAYTTLLDQLKPKRLRCSKINLLSIIKKSHLLSYASPVSQDVPENPAAQVQVNEFFPVWQVPLFLQGESWQRSTSINIIRILVYYRVFTKTKSVSSFIT